MLDTTQSALRFLKVILDFQKLVFLAAQSLFFRLFLPCEGLCPGWSWGGWQDPQPALLLAEPSAPGTAAGV